MLYCSYCIYTQTNLATAAKFAIEQYYTNVERLRREREARAVRLEEQLERNGASEAEAEQQRRELAQRETGYTRLRRVKLREASFEKLERIGRGAFGEVWLVQLKGSTHVFAMKKMTKSAVMQRGKAEHIRAERDALAAGAAGAVPTRDADPSLPVQGADTSASPWLVRLFYSFQDREHLYLVMEFVPGGDLMGLLVALDTFTEAQARFYTAEILLAIEAMHALNYIHRDIKPDNLLIDATGHLKLSDFGLVSGLESSRRQALYRRLRDESTELMHNDTLRRTRKQTHETWRRRRRVMAWSVVSRFVF